MPHISIRPEILFHLYGFPITNSLLLTDILLVFFTILTVTFYIQNEKNPSSSFVFFVRWVVKGLYTFFESLLKEKTPIFFPLIASFFFFILLSNWVGLVPGAGSILIGTHEEKIPLLRAPTADLNTTLALALISVFAIQYYGFKFLGPKYTTKFINIKSPIGFMLGLLDILSEFSRVLSFAFRLFGNVFAGEVLLIIIASLIPVLASFPFLMLELFVGFIQALVFSMLSAVFISSAITHAEH